MSISNVDLIRDALGLLGVLRETQTPSAEQGEHGLRVLNEMLADWESDGVDIGYVPATSLADILPVDDGVVSVVKHNLAHMLAPYYARQTPDVVLERAITGYNRLRRDAVKAQLAPADMTHLPLGERNHWFDINSGE